MVLCTHKYMACNINVATRHNWYAALLSKTYGMGEWVHPRDKSHFRYPIKCGSSRDADMLFPLYIKRSIFKTPTDTFISNMFNSDWFMTWYNMQSQCHNYKMSRFCNWLSFQCLVPWINHLPIYWSASYISNLKWQWIRTFDIIDSTFFILLIMFIYIWIYIYFCVLWFDRTLGFPTSVSRLL